MKKIFYHRCTSDLRAKIKSQFILDVSGIWIRIQTQDRDRIHLRKSLRSASAFMHCRRRHPIVTGMRYSFFVLFFLLLPLPTEIRSRFPSVEASAIDVFNTMHRMVSIKSRSNIFFINLTYGKKPWSHSKFQPDFLCEREIGYRSASQHSKCCDGKSISQIVVNGLHGRLQRRHSFFSRETAESVIVLRCNVYAFYPSALCC